MEDQQLIQVTNLFRDHLAVSTEIARSCEELCFDELFGSNALAQEKAE